MNAHAPITLRTVVFYDGGCPLCRKEIDYYRRLDARGRVDWRDIHAEPDVLEGSGVAWEDAMARLHVLDRDGRLRSGADAFTVIWDELPGWRWLARTVRSLRLVGLLEWGYRLWLRHRPPRVCLR